MLPLVFLLSWIFLTPYLWEEWEKFDIFSAQKEHVSPTLNLLSFVCGISTAYLALFFGVYDVNGLKLYLISTILLFLFRNKTSIGKNTKSMCRGIIFSFLNSRTMVFFFENINPRHFEQEVLQILSGFIFTMVVLKNQTFIYFPSQKALYRLLY